MSDLGAIDLTKPFSDQQTIQSFLGNPTIQDSTTVSSDMLHRFLQLTEQYLNESLKTSLKQPLLVALKLGYERKVLISESNQYIIESQFVSNSTWQPDYDQTIRSGNLAEFLSPVSAQTEAPEDVGNDTEDSPILPRLSSFDPALVDQLQLIAFNEALIDEIYRLYPNLQDCEEVHIYLFINVSDPSLQQPEQTDGGVPAGRPRSGGPRLGSPRLGSGSPGLDSINDAPEELALQPMLFATTGCPRCPSPHSGRGHLRDGICFRC